MRSRVAYFMVAYYVVILTHPSILRVKGQQTVHGFENGGCSIDIVGEIQQLFETNYHRQNEQVQQIHELHYASFQEMRRQLDSVMTSLQELNRRSQEQFRDMTNLNVSFQQMKSQLDSVVTSLQEADLHSQEQIQNIKNL